MSEVQLQKDIMALSNDHPIQITSPDYKTSRESDLAQWLAKEAEGGVQPENNEDKSTVEYGELRDRPQGAIPKQPTAVEQLMTNQHNKAQKERREIAGRAYATTPAAERTDQALLGANFDHAARGEFTAHSLLLQSKTKEASSGTLSAKIDAMGLLRRA
jgi:hypothetical protein